ncbi:MAG: cation:proton antiporter [Bacteroidales bacterium]|nr:cation:proton antiporter [Bacteroidales bacterium]
MILSSINPGNSYFLVLVIGVLVLLSYAFGLISQRTKIPSVLLLLTTGIVSKILIEALGIKAPPTQTLMEIFGIIGVILIVLEGTLELKLTREKLPIVRKSFFSALIILVISAGLIALILKFFTPDGSMHTCLVNAIPLAVISSAIAIPSVMKFDENKREFIIYEAIFSDILGIVLFNIVVANPTFSTSAVTWILTDFFLVTLLSLGFTILLIYLMSRKGQHVHFFLLLSVLSVMYAGGKLMHLSSLLLIMLFGLLLNNVIIFKKWIPEKWHDPETFSSALNLFKIMVEESSFLIRTFFFFIFGFSVHLILLTDTKVLLTGTLILIVLYGIRFLYLKFIMRSSDTISQLLIAPRGLITILLFYSIPKEYSIGLITEGVVFFVILISAILMMFGLMYKKKDNLPMEVFVGKNRIDIEDSEENDD